MADTYHVEWRTRYWIKHCVFPGGARAHPNLAVLMGSALLDDVLVSCGMEEYPHADDIVSAASEQFPHADAPDQLRCDTRCHTGGSPTPATAAQPEAPAAARDVHSQRTQNASAQLQRPQTAPFLTATDSGGGGGGGGILGGDRELHSDWDLGLSRGPAGRQVPPHRRRQRDAGPMSVHASLHDLQAELQEVWEAAGGLMVKKVALPSVSDGSDWQHHPKGCRNNNIAL
jgi:hypothetical protein